MKALRRLLRRRVRCWLACGIPAWLAGCATGPDWSLTHQLWNNESLQNFNEPAYDPRLQLFADERHSDVLVVYDEVRERDGAIRRRAFFVNRNLERLRAGEKPHFVRAGVAAKLRPIPILKDGSGEQTSASGLCVRLSSTSREATLFLDGRAVQTVELPTYGATGSVKKVLLTPLAVTGDTLLVATVVGLIAAHAWVESGASVSFCD
jgi:hypothetical protein